MATHAMPPRRSRRGRPAPNRLLVSLLVLLACCVPHPSHGGTSKRMQAKENALRASEERAARAGMPSQRSTRQPPQPPCDRLHQECPDDPSQPRLFSHERASRERMAKEDATADERMAKPARHGDPERHRRDPSLSDGWRELDKKIHGWRDGEFGEIDEPEGPWADGDEPPKDYYMCKKRYEDVFDDSRALHSLCAWRAKGVLCEKINDPYMCKRHMGDRFYSDVRFPEFADLCEANCLRNTEEEFASAFSTRGNDASAQVHNWRNTPRKPAEETRRRPLSPEERQALSGQGPAQGIGGAGPGPHRGRRAGTGADSKEEDLKQRVFANLHEKLYKQKEAEREAAAAAGEVAAAAAVGDGAATIDLLYDEGGDAEVYDPPPPPPGLSGEQAWAERARKVQARQPQRDGARRAEREPAAPVKTGGVSDLPSRAKGALKNRGGTGWGSKGKVRATGAPRGMGSSVAGPTIRKPPQPFMHEQASLEKMKREDAARHTMPPSADQDAGSDAAFDPLYWQYM